MFTQEDIQRFWSMVNKAPDYKKGMDCWIWEGPKTSRSYPVFSIHGKKYTPAKVAYYLRNRRWPKRKLRKICKDPWCVNPDHFYMASGQRAAERKLSYEDAWAIKNAMINEYRYGLGTELAKKYNITRAMVSAIAHGLTYKFVNVPNDSTFNGHCRQKLSQAARQEIIKAYTGKRGEKAALSRKYGVSKTLINRIIKEHESGNNIV